MEAEGISHFLIQFHIFILCKIHIKIILPKFFKQSEIVPICDAENPRAVWTQHLSGTKIVSVRHVSAKCDLCLKPNLNDYSLAVLK